MLNDLTGGRWDNYHRPVSSVCCISTTWVLLGITRYSRNLPAKSEESIKIMHGLKLKRESFHHSFYEKVTS